jgi:hypothetical protein
MEQERPLIGVLLVFAMMCFLLLLVVVVVVFAICGISDCYLINFCNNPEVLRLKDDVFHDTPTSISSLPRQKVKRRRTKAERKAQEEALIEARGRASTQQKIAFRIRDESVSRVTHPPKIFRF